MHLEGHSARVVMLRAEARCIAKTHFPSTPSDCSLPTPKGSIQVQEEPESTSLCCSSIFHAPGHPLSPSSFLPARASSSLLLTGPSTVAHTVFFSSPSPSFPLSSLSSPVSLSNSILGGKWVGLSCACGVWCCCSFSVISNHLAGWLFD